MFLRICVAAILMSASTTTQAVAQLAPTSGRFLAPQPIELPLRFMHGLISVPVMINGQGPFQMLLDTGAPLVVLRDTALIGTLKLNVAGQARVGGAGDGEMQVAPFVTGLTATLGALEVKNASGIVTSLPDAIPGVDGVIGGPLFRHAVVHVDFDAGVIRFHDPASPPNVVGDTIPLRVAPNGHVFIPGRITVNGVGRELDLHLDTGARQAFALAPASLKQMRVKPRASIQTITGFGSRGMGHGSLIRSDTLRIGRTALTNVTTTVPNNEPADEGRVGIQVLRRFNLVIDYPGRRLILAPRANVKDPFNATTTGIVLKPALPGSARAVAYVVSASPAEQAGILVGDTIATVGGRDVGGFDPEALERELLQAAPGTALVIGTRRGGQSIERRLTTRALLP